MLLHRMLTFMFHVKIVINVLLHFGANLRLSVAQGIEVKNYVNRSCHVNKPLVTKQKPCRSGAKAAQSVKTITLKPCQYQSS